MYHFTARSFSHKVELEDIHIRTKCPSVFAEHAAQNVSGNYTFLPSSEIICAMRETGWAVVDVQEQRVRLEDRRGFQKHLIKFQRRDLIAKLGEYASEVSIINSHDRSCAFRVCAAIYRFVCANGLMVSDSTLQSISVRHSGHEIREVIDAAQRVFNGIDSVTAKISEMKARRLSPQEQIDFAKNAIQLRWQDNAPTRPEKFLVSRRQEDDNASLWAVFNKVQERVIGGKFLTPFETQNGEQYRRVRAVTGLDATIKLNKQLWTMADNLLTSGVVQMAT